MKGILIEPGKAPVVTTLPDTLQGIEAMLGCDCTQKVLPRTPAVLVYGILGKGLNRIYRGQNIYGTILCYGWKNNSLVPMSKDLQAEMLDRLKEMEVRVGRTTPSVPNFPTRRFMPVTVDGSGAGTAAFGKKAAS